MTLRRAKRSLILFTVVFIVLIAWTAPKVIGSGGIASGRCPIAVPDSGASPTIVLIDSAGTVDPDVIDVESQYQGVDPNGRRISVHTTAMAALVRACAPNARLIAIAAGNHEFQFGVDAAATIRRAIELEPHVLLVGFGTPVDSEALRAAVADAEANDVLVVAPAGNTRAPSALLEDRQGAPLYKWNEPIYPAAYETVLAVGALDADNLTSADYSQDLPYVDVAAPGTSLTLPGELFADIDLTGTSYATPQVAAVAAVARWLAPDLSSAELRRLVVATAKPLDQRDTAAGAGVVQPLDVIESLEDNNKLALRVSGGVRVVGCWRLVGWDPLESGS